MPWPRRPQRKAGLRLDVREEELKVRKGVVEIAPGDPGTSALMDRIHSANADEVMPPPDVDKALTAAEKLLLARWIQQGAEYPAAAGYGGPGTRSILSARFPQSMERARYGLFHRLHRCRPSDRRAPRPGSSRLIDVLAEKLALVPSPHPEV